MRDDAEDAGAGRGCGVGSIREQCTVRWLKHKYSVIQIEANNPHLLCVQNLVHVRCEVFWTKVWACRRHGARGVPPCLAKATFGINVHSVDYDASTFPSYYLLKQFQGLQGFSCPKL